MMLVLPPLTDPTLRVVSDTPVLDLNDHLVHRLAAPDRLDALAGGLDTAGATGDRALHALFARAAAAVLRAGRPDRARLRALGMGLRLATADDPAVNLAVDDVELVGGTTQRSRDVLRAVARTDLFAAEVDRARAALTDGGTLRIVLDTDQQLPGAFAIALGVGPEHVTMCGRFAVEHHAALVRIPELRGCRFTGEQPPREVRAEWAGPGPAPRWATEPGDVPRNGPWAGWLDAAAVAALPAASLERCRSLTVTIARLPSWAAVTGATGETADLRPALDRLPAEVPVAADLLVGAPGAEPETALARLREPAGRVRLAGLRPFRVPAGAHRWPVADRPADDHDLPRWARSAAAAPVAVPVTVPAELAAAADLYPGRLAGAALRPDPGGGDTYWDPSATVVPVRDADPDGRGPGTFLVSLRTGTVMRLAPRLASLLERLSAGGGDALAGLRADRRAALVDRLTSAGVLRGAA
ncbi:hypothetical protein DPM19_04275 [Actinomadura craniellae]|uniref:Uncharacterized protein n=1 Tax=Actinomadura craniellae TaxID=2231787 RepID=A0A365HAM0_9ACTN|nr:hypothetical protein [Actinomadura craniellae]RAY16147.1 hypothetical protein DPM19_04275 [Actinomadura craniellae]